MTLTVAGLQDEFDSHIQDEVAISFSIIETDGTLYLYAISGDKEHELSTADTKHPVGSLRAVRDTWLTNRFKDMSKYFVVNEGDNQIVRKLLIDDENCCKAFALKYEYRYMVTELSSIDWAVLKTGEGEIFDQVCVQFMKAEQLMYDPKGRTDDSPAFKIICEDGKIFSETINDHKPITEELEIVGTGYPSPDLPFPAASDLSHFLTIYNTSNGEYGDNQVTTELLTQANVLAADLESQRGQSMAYMMDSDFDGEYRGEGEDPFDEFLNLSSTIIDMIPGDVNEDFYSDDVTSLGEVPVFFIHYFSMEKVEGQMYMGTDPALVDAATVKVSELYNHEVDGIDPYALRYAYMAIVRGLIGVIETGSYEQIPSGASSELFNLYDDITGTFWSTEEATQRISVTDNNNMVLPR